MLKKRIVDRRSWACLVVLWNLYYLGLINSFYLPCLRLVYVKSVEGISNVRLRASSNSHESWRRYIYGPIDGFI